VALRQLAQALSGVLIMGNMHLSHADVFYKWKACLRKKKYPSKEAAYDHFNKWDIYQCPHCGKFHRASPMGTRINERRRLEEAFRKRPS